MLALIEKGAPHEAHPAYWAPFVVVGEGRCLPIVAQPAIVAPADSGKEERSQASFKESEPWTVEIWKRQ